VGITDQLTHNRISYNQYGNFISECYNEVLRLDANFYDRKSELIIIKFL